MSQTEHTVTLRTGFTDDEGVTHKTLVFGHRITGRDLVQVDREIAGSKSAVRRECALYRQSLIKFGDLPEDKWLHALLSLNSIDRSAVTVAFNEFHRISAEGREPKTLSIETVRLGWPVKREEHLFDTVTFGHLLTGYDEVEADSLAGAENTFFLTARMISRLSSSEGEQALEGPFDHTLFRELSFEDIVALNQASDGWEAEQVRLSLGADTEQSADVTAAPVGVSQEETQKAVELVN